MYKILWNFEIQMDPQIIVRKPEKWEKKNNERNRTAESTRNQNVWRKGNLEVFGNKELSNKNKMTYQQVYFAYPGTHTSSWQLSVEYADYTAAEGENLPYTSEATCWPWMVTFNTRGREPGGWAVWELTTEVVKRLTIIHLGPCCTRRSVGEDWSD